VVPEFVTLFPFFSLLLAEHFFFELASGLALQMQNSQLLVTNEGQKGFAAAVQK
jgi:hypothetical protein